MRWLREEPLLGEEGLLLSAQSCLFVLEIEIPGFRHLLCCLPVLLQYFHVSVFLQGIGHSCRGVSGINKAGSNDS